ncbi:hypothetical protein AB6E26_20115 [Vibrio splendidus]
MPVSRPTLKGVLEGKLEFETVPDYAPSFFSYMNEKDVRSGMVKYPFSSFEDIPKDKSGLKFPAFDDIQFYPSKLIESEGFKVVDVNGFAFIGMLGKSAFCIDPRRWHKIKEYLSNGCIEYPECHESEFGVMDGRHRTLLIMQIYNRKTIPIAVPKRHYELVIEKAKLLNALT